MSIYPSIDPVATGARIKELRIENQLSVKDISCYMGFEEPQAVYKWQRGEALPTIDNLYALSKLLNTSMDNIIRGREETVRVSSLGVYRELLYTFITLNGAKSYRFYKSYKSYKSYKYKK